jgi:hypothetical protein
LSKWDRLRDKILGGRADNNVSFDDLTRFVERLGFERRTTGGHHTFYREGIEEIISLQPKSDGKAKSYQVKQVREIIEKYGL